jgi:preprotein translocase subunit SecG
VGGPVMAEMTIIMVVIIAVALCITVFIEGD